MKGWGCIDAYSRSEQSQGEVETDLQGECSQGR